MSAVDCAAAPGEALQFDRREDFAAIGAIQMKPPMVFTTLLYSRHVPATHTALIWIVKKKHFLKGDVLRMLNPRLDTRAAFAMHLSSKNRKNKGN